jgi:hypothetical protein
MIIECHPKTSPQQQSQQVSACKSSDLHRGFLWPSSKLKTSRFFPTRHPVSEAQINGWSPRFVSEDSDESLRTTSNEFPKCQS